MEEILIAGGAGFIGSFLTEKFLELGHKVTVLDNLSSGNKMNISELLNSNKVNFVNQDISEQLDIPADIIINLASRASPKDFSTHAMDILKTNSYGIFNLIENADRYNSRLVQASTSEVYGEPLISPQDESYRGNVNPIGLRSCYDEGKRFAEALLYAYYRSNKSDVRIARIFNTYGPRMRMNDGRVIPNFVFQALSNKDITIYADGLQTRSFCYVTDMVDGLVKLTLKDERDVNGKIFNLGNPNSITIIELAKLILEITNSKSDFRFLAKPEDDPTNRCPNITKAKILLEWEPQVKLINGLRDTVNYYKKILN